MENNFNAQLFKNKKESINIFYSLLEEEHGRIKKNIEEDKNWLENQPYVQEFLNKLQYFLQEKNIAFFSKLITTLVNEILGDSGNSDEENESIKSIIKEINFNLDVKLGVPALNIDVMTENNTSEEITSGGLKNVIATGLRVLALWRLTNNKNNNSSNKGEFTHRKFIVLDEPDCWISENSIANYAKFLSQLSEYFNLQIVMVTHKNPNYFKKYGKIYTIKNNNFVKLSLLSEVERSDDVYNENYIKKMHLKNFKAHKDTIIEFDPRLTVIIGKSNSGKSVIMEAFNAIINNSSNDKCIRHFENRASVSLYIKDSNFNSVLTWERVKKTNQEFPQKVRYTLNKEAKNGVLTLLNDEFNSHKVPEFAENILKMKKIDNIDVHLGKQEDMNFLLSHDITDNERAKILSLGKETSYIHKMMDDLKIKTRELKINVKNNEFRYNKILLALCELSKIDEDDIIYNSLISLEKDINNHDLFIEKFDNIYLNIVLSNKIASIDFKYKNNDIKIFDKINDLDHKLLYLDYLVKILELEEINEIESIVKIMDFTRLDEIVSFSYLEKINEIIFNYNSYKCSDIYNLDYINTLIQKDINIELINEIHFNDDKNEDIVIHSVKEIDEYGKKIKFSLENEIKNNDNLVKINKEIEENKKNIINLEKELKVCPTCGSSLT